SAAEIQQLVEASYADTANAILTKFNMGLSPEQLAEVVSGAYGEQWHHPDITPVTTLKENQNLYLLELGHGPTLAFKNVGLEFLGRYLDMVNTEMLRALGASSGDTINAAHNATRGRSKLHSIFLLPETGPSDVQMLQALAHDIETAMTILISGDFDIAQDAIKTFNAPEHHNFKAENNFISFNSIQILRILTQMVYYFRAYTQLMKQEVIQNGDEVDFSVPSANFGDALAGHWAREMGLPIHSINIATNANDVLHRFLETGTYTVELLPSGIRKPATQTRAPSQDITVSSNFERALFWACDGDSSRVKGWMTQLKETGSFTVDYGTLTQLRSIFTSSKASDEDIVMAQQWAWQECGRLIDPHTATAVFPFAHGKKPSRPTVCLSTAHPIQFSSPDGVPEETQYADEVAILRNRKPESGKHFLRSGTIIHEIHAAVVEAVSILNEGRAPIEDR
ncbi:MAG: Uncharacterized protein Greene101449_1327, partial [Candidatus Peregrinibacteria bacterium Greene1014_49]